MSTPHSRTTLKLVCFACLSLLAHVLLIFGTAIPLPQLASVPPPLSARLQPSEAPRDTRPAAPAKKHRALARQTAPPAAEAPVAPQASPDNADVADLASPAPDAAQSAPLPDTAAAEIPAPAPVDTPVAEATPPYVAPIERRLPQKGEITYVLYLGANKFKIGRTRQTWEIQGNLYQLSSISETTGLAAVFAGQRLAYASRGRLTARGLQPETFTTHRVRSGRSEDGGADFDWGAMTAAIGNPRQSVALPAGTQDIISFMYQLGLTTLVPGRIELPITNGWKLERYELDVGTEERLQTPLGALLAFPVKQVRRPGQESIELWLAPAYRLLPVRIRFFDRQGEPSGEQVVDDIRVSSD